MKLKKKRDLEKKKICAFSEKLGHSIRFLELNRIYSLSNDRLWFWKINAGTPVSVEVFKLIAKMVICNKTDISRFK